MIKDSTKFLSISLAGVAALAMLAPSAVAGEKKLPAKRVVVQSAVIVSGDAAGPDPQDPTVKAAARGKYQPAEVSFTVPAGTAKAQKKAEKEAMDRAQAELTRRAEDSSGKGGTEVTTQAFAEIGGNCGYSAVSLTDFEGYETASVMAGINLFYPFYAYRVNVHVWNTSAWDGWDKDLPRTGNNSGAQQWGWSWRIQINDSGDKYGAKMNRGEVYLGNDRWCYTGEPKVDNVKIY